MKIPILLIYKDREVAKLTEFGYEFPWASAKGCFTDIQLLNKLEAIASFNNFSLELEEQDLPEVEEDALWEGQLAKLGLSPEDLKITNNVDWKVRCDDGTLEEVRAISCEDGWLMWRG